MNSNTGEIRQFPDGQMPPEWKPLGNLPRVDCPLCKGKGHTGQIRKEGKIFVFKPCVCTNPEGQKTLAESLGEICRLLKDPAPDIEVLSRELAMFNHLCSEPDLKIPSDIFDRLSEDQRLTALIGFAAVIAQMIMQRRERRRIITRER